MFFRGPEKSGPFLLQRSSLDKERLKILRHHLSAGRIPQAIDFILQWFESYQLSLELYPNRERAVRPFLWHAIADMAEFAGYHRLTEQFWLHLEATVQPPLCCQDHLPLLGIPIVNGADRLERLLESIDVPVHTLAIVDHSNSRLGPVASLLTTLERDSYPGISQVKIARPFGNSGVAKAWNSILQSFPQAPYALIANHDIVFAPGCLKQLMESIDSSLPQWIPMLSRPFSFSVFAITPAVWNRIGLFDESFIPAYWEDTDYRDRLESDPGIQRIEHGPWIQTMDQLNSSHSASIGDDEALASQNEISFALNRLWYFSRRRIQGDYRGEWLRSWLRSVQNDVNHHDT